MATASTDSGGNGGQANSNNGADANASTTGTSNADNLQKIKLRQLATKAKGHFDQGKYDDCIGVLKSIVKEQDRLGIILLELVEKQNMIQKLEKLASHLTMILRQILMSSKILQRREYLISKKQY